MFPKPGRFGHLDVSGAVVSITAAEDRITVVVNHGQSRGLLMANAVYTLDGSFRPTVVATGDEYEAAFRAMVNEGSVPAGAPERVDAEREFVPLRRWDSLAKRYVPVPLVGRK